PKGILRSTIRVKVSLAARGALEVVLASGKTSWVALLVMVTPAVRCIPEILRATIRVKVSLAARGALEVVLASGKTSWVALLVKVTPTVSCFPDVTPVRKEALLVAMLVEVTTMDDRVPDI
ncbi:hypothetical protein pipiens_018428, partial [Culex pipiens pipiens]